MPTYYFLYTERGLYAPLSPLPFSTFIQPLSPVFTDGGTNNSSTTNPSPANAQGKDASGVQFQAPEPSPLPPSVEAVSPQGVVIPNNATANPITTQPDPLEPNNPAVVHPHPPAPTLKTGQEPLYPPPLLPTLTCHP